MKILTAPSLFASNLAEIGSEARRAEKAGADVLHFDIWTVCTFPISALDLMY